MAFVNIRVKLIKQIVDLVEKIVFERRIGKFYRKSFEGNSLKTVIDVGANKGQSIDFFLSINPNAKVYALEPNPSLYLLLRKKYASNPSVKLFNIGVSDFSGQKLFFENVFDYTSSFEELNEESIYLKKKARILGVEPDKIVSKKYQVNVITLGEFIKNEISESSIDVLKIDTEGHEFYCLKGLFNSGYQNKVRYIQIENHNDDMYLNRVPYKEVENLLNLHGFHEDAVISHGFSDLDEVVFKLRSTG
ncbi:MAG: FkbM family methyltransferase [Arcticibacter sp.]